LIAAQPDRRFRLPSLAALLSICTLVALLLPMVFPDSRRIDIGAVVEHTDGTWVATSISAGGVAAAAGLAVGDIVTTTDADPPLMRRRTDPELDLSRSSQWTISRQGQTLILRPQWQASRWFTFGEPASMLLVALMFWGVGASVRRLRPLDEVSKHFWYLCLTIALVLALSPAAGADVIWARAIEVPAFALLPAVFLRFFIEFPHNGPPRGVSLAAVRVLWLAGAIAGTGYLVAGLLGSEWFYLFRTVLLGLLASGFLGGLTCLAKTYVSPRTPDTRQRVLIVLLGAVLAVVPLVLLSVLPIGLGVPELVRPQIAALSLTFLPLGFAYAILRHQVFDIDVLVNRTLVSGAMTFVLAGTYGLVFYALGTVGEGLNSERGPFVLLVLSAVVALTFVPLREAAGRLIDRLIYRDRFDLVRVLESFGGQLASDRSIDVLLSDVASSLARATDLRGVVVLIETANEGLKVRASCGDYASEAVAQEIADRVVHPSTAKPADVDGLVIPLTAHGDRVGTLILGPKRVRAEFSAEEAALFASVASQTAAAIANALLVERLQEKVVELELLRDRLRLVQETTSKRLAQDLHDTTLHTVLGLIRQTEDLADAVAESHRGDRGFADRLGQLVEKQQDVAYELRELCTNLYPSELAFLGLAPALAGIARKFSREENLIVRFQADGFPIEHRLSQQFEEALYRVVLEALDNACRHANARTATITLQRDRRCVDLTISDDGQGFAIPTSFGSLLHQGHIGLVGMQDRIRQLGGELSIVSAPGGGTTIRASLSIGEEP
jgi:signal transduction histidine kinase